MRLAKRAVIRIAKHLPVIGRVSDHLLLASDGTAADLVAVKKQRIAVVAFVYTNCHEVTGCPFSLGVMQRLDRVIAAEPELAHAVRLITVSFDPTRDGPAKLSALRALHKPKTDWLFATTGSERELEGILADFDQPLAKLLFEDGSWSGVFRHVLKVFLLDAHDEIRNVYSVGFLNPELVIGDLRVHGRLRPQIRDHRGEIFVAEVLVFHQRKCRASVRADAIPKNARELPIRASPDAGL